MATLSDLRTALAIDLRDTSNATWSTPEIDRLINQGIDALSVVYPKEIVQTVGTVSAGVSSYSVSDFTNISKVSFYASDGTYRMTLDPALGDPNSGWEVHAGVLYLPPSYTFEPGSTIHVFGYGRYIQLAASTSTTDLDSTGTWAVMVFAQAEALGRLISDRARFQQWQANSNGSDVTALGMAQLASAARARWQEERQRLRRMRKTG